MRCSIRRVWLSRSNAPRSGHAHLVCPALTCLGRHTLSGLLCTAGQQFRDWSAAYRLFERERLAPQALWRVPLNGVLEILPPASPVVALLDDTLVRKRGHRIAGTSWRRDPLDRILRVISSGLVASRRFPWGPARASRRAREFGPCHSC